MRVKILQKKITSVTIDITCMKYFNVKLNKYNKLLAEDSKYHTKLNENLRLENSEVLRVKKDPEKMLKQICA